MLPFFILSEKNQQLKNNSRVQLSATPWTIALEAPPSMEFSRQEQWSRLSFPPPEDLPDPGIEPRSPVLQADSLLFEPPAAFFGKQERETVHI